MFSNAAQLVLNESLKSFVLPILHYILGRDINEALQENPDFQRLPQAALPRGTKPTVQAKNNRDIVCQYVNSDVGAVPWQWDKI